MTGLPVVTDLAEGTVTLTGDGGSTLTLGHWRCPLATLRFGYALDVEEGAAILREALSVARLRGLHALQRWGWAVHPEGLAA